MKNHSLILSALFLVLMTAFSIAQIPRTLSYQGVLTDNAGRPRPDGNYPFKFCLYGSNGGSPIWCEEKTLPVKNGLFSTALGEQTPFGATIKFDQQYWLGIQVGNEPELSPRIALTSVGYSFSSLRADTASVSVASLADTTWRHVGLNIYRLHGNVGIGTTAPGAKLDILANSKTWNEWDEAIRFSKPSGGSAITYPGGGLLFGLANDRHFYFADVIDNSYIMSIDASPAGGGNVGIGTINPGATLDIVAATKTWNEWREAIRLSHGVSSAITHPAGGLLFGLDSDRHFYFADMLESNYIMTIDANPAGGGNVGIGTTAPVYPLDVTGNIRSTAGVIAGTLWTGDGTSGNIRKLTAGIPLYFKNSAGTQEMTIDGSGNVGIGTENPTAKLDVAGRTKTQVLEITGGSDLAEPFKISESQSIPKGALVIIDEENPGRLKLSHQAYDKRVAGVVSGAGDINPGLTLTRQGVMEGGQNFALSGRVYALATAANGPIKPGDLLTTSDIPGHAMKATDRERWDGAIIGKAMSSLEKGKGLVLVLVNLQ